MTVIRFIPILALLMGPFLCERAQAQSESEEPFEEKAEKAIRYKELPQKVKKSYQSSPFEPRERASVEEVETDRGTLYEIEVKRRDPKVDELYYNEKGALVHRGVEEAEADEAEDDEDDEDDGEAE